MDDFVDYSGQTIVLDKEIKKNVFNKHPEVSQFFDRITKTLQEPELVKQSKTSKRVRLYYHFFNDIFNGKYFVVVVKLVDQHFVSTFYITDKVKEGEIIWQKNS